MTFSPRILSNNTCCFCPTEHINWNRPNGLSNCNLPCNATTNIYPVVGWYIDRDTNVIVIPERSEFIPGIFAFLPCFWGIFCCIIPILHAESHILYEHEGQLRLDRKTKFFNSEELKYFRNISHAEIETKLFYPLENQRIVFYNTTGLENDTSDWFSDWTSFSKNTANQLVETINQRARDIQARHSVPINQYTNTNQLTVLYNYPPKQQQQQQQSMPVYSQNMQQPIYYDPNYPQIQMQIQPQQQQPQQQQQQQVYHQQPNGYNKVVIPQNEPGTQYY